MVFVMVTVVKLDVTLHRKG